MWLPNEMILLRLFTVMNHPLNIFACESRVPGERGKQLLFTMFRYAIMLCSAVVNGRTLPFSLCVPVFLITVLMV